MNRRELLLGLAAIAVPPLASAQSLSDRPRIAFVATPVLNPDYVRAFFEGLADFGYADGVNIVVEFFAAPTISDIPAYAQRAIATKPDLIFTNGAPAPLAVKELTATIPVVFTGINDPLGLGLIPSLAHPG